MASSAIGGESCTDSLVNLMPNTSQDDPERSVSSAQARRMVTSTVANAMLEAVPFNEHSTSVMDYACGSGTSSSSSTSRSVLQHYHATKPHTTPQKSHISDVSSQQALYHKDSLLMPKVSLV